MGDRSNIVIEDHSGERVYLYGHWMGEDSLVHAVHGLESGRVGDAAYLARIVFCAMVRGQEESETGFGISTRLLDNEYPLVVIAGDNDRGLTWLEDEHGSRLTQPVTGALFVTAVKNLDPGDEEGIFEALTRVLRAAVAERGTIVPHAAPQKG